MSNPADFPGDHKARVEEVIVTDELARRPSRSPDHAREAEALRDLADIMAREPGALLQSLAGAAMALTHSGSAGISLLETDGARGAFRWVAASGGLARHRGDTLPPDADPSSEAIKRNAVLLLREPGRVFAPSFEAEAEVHETLLAPFAVHGKPAGTVWAIKHDPQDHFEREDARLLESLARFAAAAHGMMQALHGAQAANQRSKTELAARLADAELLQRLSTSLISEQEADALYEQSLTAAIALMRADAASLQILSPDGNQLILLAARNLHPQSVAHWQVVDAGNASSCGQSLQSHARVVVGDAETEASYAGTQDLEEFRRSGIRAAQSTPLVARSGKPIGLISTHWHEPRRLAEADFRLLDVLARQLADLIERAAAEAAKRENEERQALLLRLSDTIRTISDPAEIQQTAMQLLGNHLGLSRAYYFDVVRENGGWVPVIDAAWQREPDKPSMIGRHALANFGDRMFEGFARGQVIAAADVGALTNVTPEELSTYRALGVTAFINVPLLRGGEYIAGIGAHDIWPHVWTEGEIDLIREVAARTWTAVERARAEGALHESQERYRGLFDTMDQGFCIVEKFDTPSAGGSDYRYLEANPAFVRHTGLPDPVGRTIRELVPNADVETLDRYDRVVRTGQPERFESYISALDLWMEAEVFPAKAQGQLAVLFTKINARKRAEAALRESGERFRALVTAGATSIYRMSADWRIMYELDSPDFLAKTAEATEDWVDYYILPEDRQAVNEAIEQAIRTRSMLELEHRVALADGGVGWIVSRAVPMLGPDGEIVEWFGAGSDITARKRFEQDLRESEEKYQALFAASPVPFFVLSPEPPDFTFVAANDAYLAVTMKTREDLIGRKAFDVFTDDPSRPGANGPDQFRASIARVLASGRRDALPRTRYDISRPGGGFEERWWLAISAPVLDTTGKVTAIIHQISDETDLHLGEVAQLEHQARQAALLKLSDSLRPLSDPIEIQAISDRTLGEYLALDHACYIDIDIDRQVATVVHEYQQGDFPSLTGEHSFAAFGAILALLRAGQVAAFNDVNTDPSFCPADLPSYRSLQIRSMVSTPIMKNGLLVAAMGAISASPRAWTEAEIALVQEVGERTWGAIERARAEAALRRSEERLALAFSTLPLGIAIIDANGEISTANDEMRRFLPTGLIPSHHPEHSARWQGWDADGKIVLPEDFPTARALRGEAVSPGMQMLYREDSGTEIWTEVLAVPLSGTAGQIDGAMTAVIDVDRLKRSEQAAQASEERLRQFGEASLDVLWIRDADTLQWTYLTPAFETIYGLSREQALTGDNYRVWQDLILPEDRDRAVANISRVWAGERVTFEYRIRRPVDGQVRWLRNTDFPMCDEAGRVVRIGGVGHDVTALKAIQAAMADSETRLRTLTEGIPQLVWRSSHDGLWTWVSPQWMAFTGQSQEESHGWGWLDAVHPDDHAAAIQAWEAAQPNGRLDVEFRVHRAYDGGCVWHRTRSVPVRGASGSDGRILEWLGTTTDIDDLKRLQGEQQVLVAELQHRTRNLLSVVRNVARRSFGASPERNEYDSRLAAIGRVQGFLSRSPGYSVPLAELVEAEMHAVGDGASSKVEIAGPPVDLPGESVQAVALALHELATNAVKYGAIAQPSGQLSVTWRIEATQDGLKRLVIDWRESGVSMPEGPPARRGYGTELITRALPYQLRAETTLQFEHDGVWCRIMLPASAFNSRIEKNFA